MASLAVRRASGRTRWWRDARRRRMLAVADLGAGGLALLAGYGDLVALAALPLWILFAKVGDLYDRDHRVLRHLTIDELGSLVALTVTGMAVGGGLVAIANTDSLDPLRVLGGLVAGVLASLLLRAAARRLWRRMTPAEVTAILGEGDAATSLRRQLHLFKDMHIELVDDDCSAGILDGTASTAELEGLAEQVDRLIVAADSIDSEALTRIADSCRDAEAKLGVVAPISGSGGPSQQLAQIADLAVVDCETWDLSRSTLAIKRAFDIAGSAFLLVAFAPAMALISLAIRLDSSGPAIFSQWRAGLGGKPFRMHKLRTMDRDAEARLAELVRIDDLAQPMFKLRNDPRVTHVGRLLRRFSLDELPQLVNVLRGEMSFVGPRPEEMPLVDRYAPEHRFRLEVKPGMTGPMQIAGRGELSFDARLAVERDYIEHISLYRDVRIMMLTIPVIVRGDGAF